MEAKPQNFSLKLESIQEGKSILFENTKGSLLKLFWKIIFIVFPIKMRGYFD
jgi:hypothetical protein